VNKHKTRIALIQTLVRFTIKFTVETADINVSQQILMMSTICRDTSTETLTPLLTALPMTRWSRWWGVL